MKKIKKFISFITAILFLLNQFGTFAAAASQVNFPSEVKASASFQIDLPPELGTIESLLSGSGPAIVHIQTAHGNYEVQKKIQTILHYLKDTYGFKLLFLEGSASKLNPDLLRLFPQRDLTMKMADELTKEALVKGDELFLLEESEVNAYGIESVEAYRKNRDAFKAVLTEKEKTEGFLRDMDMQIERLTGPYLNKDLRGFLNRLDNFETEGLPLLDYLSYLKEEAKKQLDLDLTDPRNQIEWPMLLRIYKLREFESKLDLNAFNKEREEFFKTVRIPKETFNDVKKLLSSPLSQNQLPDPETGLLFEKMVSYLPQDFNYAAYPNVNLFIGHLILQSEIKGDRLMEEINRLTDKISQKLSKNQQERKVLSLFKDYRLLKKLFALELTSNDYEEILKQRERIQPGNVAERFLELNGAGRVKNIKFKHLDAITVLFETALQFYQGTKERDKWMLDNIQTRFKETKQDKAIVITGGFHSKPFEQFFQSKGYNYALISPKITSIEGHDAYLQAALQNSPSPLKKSTMDLPRRMEPLTMQASLGENLNWVNDRISLIRQRILKQPKVSVRSEMRINDMRHEVQTFVAAMESGQPLEEILKPYMEKVPGVTPDQIATTQTEVVSVYREVSQAVDPTLRGILDHAFALSVILHADQPRASKGDSRPYIIHVAGVVKLLFQEFGLRKEISDPVEVRDVLAAAWLHDTIEDGKKGRWGKPRFKELGDNDNALREEISQLIQLETNENVLNIVKALSKPDYDGFGLTDEIQIEARYYVDLGSTPLGTQLIKAADFSFNLGDLKNHPDRAFPKKFFVKRLGPVLGFLPGAKISQEAKGQLIRFIRVSVDENNAVNQKVGDPAKAPPTLTPEQEHLLAEAETTYGARSEMRIADERSALESVFRVYQDYHFMKGPIVRLVWEKESLKLKFALKATAEFGTRVKNKGQIFDQLMHDFEEVSETTRLKSYYDLSHALAQIYQSGSEREKEEIFEYFRNTILPAVLKDEDIHRRGRALVGIAESLAIIFQNTSIGTKAEVQAFVTGDLLRYTDAIQPTVDLEDFHGDIQEVRRVHRLNQPQVRTAISTSKRRALTRAGIFGTVGTLYESSTPFDRNHSALEIQRTFDIALGVIRDEEAKGHVLTKLSASLLELHAKSDLTRRLDALEFIKRKVITPLTNPTKPVISDVEKKSEVLFEVYEAIAKLFESPANGNRLEALDRIEAEALTPALTIASDWQRSMVVSRIAGIVANLAAEADLSFKQRAERDLREKFLAPIQKSDGSAYIKREDSRLEAISKIYRAIGLVQIGTAKRDVIAQGILRDILQPGLKQITHEDALARLIGGAAQAIARIYETASPEEREAAQRMIADEVMPHATAMKDPDARLIGLSRISIALSMLYEDATADAKRTAARYIQNTLLSPALRDAQTTNHYFENLIYIYRSINRLDASETTASANLLDIETVEPSHLVSFANGLDSQDKQRFLIYLGAYQRKELVHWYLTNSDFSDEDKTFILYGNLIHTRIFPPLDAPAKIYQALNAEEIERLAAKILGSQISLADIHQFSLRVGIELTPDGWREVAEYLKYASRDPIAHLILIRNLVITLRMKGNRGEPLLEAVDIEKIPGMVKPSLIALFGSSEAASLAYPDLRLLLRGMPLDSFLINEIRIKTNNWYQKAHVKEAFVEKLREIYHDAPSSYHLTLTRAYARYMESRSEEDRLDFNRVLAPFGDEVSSQYLDSLGEHYDEVRNLVVETRDLYEDLYGKQQARGVIRILQDSGRSYLDEGIYQEILHFLNQISRIQIANELPKGLARYYATFEVANFSNQKRLTLLEAIVRIRAAVQSQIESSQTGGEKRLYLIRLQNALEPIVFNLINSFRDSWKNLNDEEQKQVLNLSLKLQTMEMGTGSRKDELSAVSHELNRMTWGQEPRRDFAVLSRLERIFTGLADETSAAYQQRAEGYAHLIDFKDETVKDFSADIVRESLLFAVSILVEKASDLVAEKNGISRWHITQTGKAAGTLVYIQNPDDIASRSFNGNEVLLADRIPPRISVPKISGIVTKTKESSLAHTAIMAGYHGIPWTSPSKTVFDELVRRATNGAAQVEMNVRQSGVTIRYLTGTQAVPAGRSEMRKAVLLPNEYKLENVGPKAYKLSLLKNKMPEFIPPHIADPFEFFQTLVKNDPTLDRLIQGLPEIQDEGLIRQRLEEIRRRILRLRIPDADQDAIRSAIDRHIGKNKKLIIRSTTNVEDLENYPGAGVYESVVNQNKEDLFKDILFVLSAFYSEKAYQERRREKFNERESFPAVLIQELVDADYSFVIHTRNPNASDPDEMIIEIALGLGESLMSGKPQYEGQAHQFSYNRKSGEVKRVGYANKSFKSTPSGDQLIDYSEDPLTVEVIPSRIDLKGLFQRAVSIEEDEQIGKRKPQDIEGTIQLREAKGRISIVQTRNQVEMPQELEKTDSEVEPRVVPAIDQKKSPDLNKYPPIFHQNNSAMSAYDLPANIFGAKGVNLVQLWLQAFEDVVGEGQVIVTPYGSLSYMVRNGIVLWENIKDFDLMFYLPNAKNEEQSWEFETTYLQKIKQRFIERVRHLGLQVDIEADGSFKLKGSVQGKPVAYEMKDENLKVLPITEIGKGAIQERQPSGYLYWHNYYADLKALDSLDQYLRVQRDLSTESMIKNAEELYRFVYDRARSDDDYRKIKELMRIAVIFNDQRLHETAVELLQAYGTKPATISERIAEHWRQLPQPGSVELHQKIAEVVQSKTSQTQNFLHNANQFLGTKQLATSYEAYYTYGFSEGNRLVDLVTYSLLKAYFNGAKLYLVATAPYPDLLGQVKKKAIEHLSDLDNRSAEETDRTVATILERTIIDFKRSPDAAGKKPWWFYKYPKFQNRDDVSVTDIVMEYLGEGHRFQPNDMVLMHHLDANSLPALLPFFISLREHDPRIMSLIHQAADLHEKPNPTQEHAARRIEGDLRPAQVLGFALQGMMKDIRTQKMTEADAIQFMRGNGTPASSIFDKAIALTKKVFQGDLTTAAPLADGRMTSLKAELKRLRRWQTDGKISEIYSLSPQGQVAALNDRHGIQDTGFKYAFVPNGTKVLIQYADAGAQKGWRYYNFGRHPLAADVSLKGLAPLLTEIEAELHDKPRTDKNQMWFTKFHAEVVMFGPVGNSSENVSLIPLQDLLEIADLFLAESSKQGFDLANFKGSALVRAIVDHIKRSEMRGTFGTGYKGYEQLFWIWDEVLQKRDSEKSAKTITITGQNTSLAANLGTEFERYLKDTGRSGVSLTDQIETANVKVYVGDNAPVDSNYDYWVQPLPNKKVQMHPLKDNDPYLSEKYRRREVDQLEEAYAISKDLTEAQATEKSVLLVGVGRGMTTVELALQYPNLRIWAVNKEDGLWDAAVIKARMLEKGYVASQIDEALNRITVKVLDVENKDERQKAFGNQKFDFVLYELWTQVYFQDQLKSTEDLFNERVSVGGIYGFTTSTVFTVEDRYHRDEDMNTRRQPDQVLIDTVKAAFGKSASLLYQSDIKGTPYFKYRRVADRPVDIPLKFITGKPESLTMGLTYRVSLYEPRSEARNLFVEEMIKLLPVSEEDMGRLDWKEVKSENTAKNREAVTASVNEIADVLKQLLRVVDESSMSPEDKEKIQEAIRLLFEKQGYILRKDLKLYPIHPLQVALSFLEEYGISDRDFVIAAILHDFMEDVPEYAKNPDLMGEQFGPVVQKYVVSLTNKEFAPAVETWFDGYLKEKTGKELTGGKEDPLDAVKAQIVYQIGVIAKITASFDTLLLKSADFNSNALKLGNLSSKPPLQARLSAKYLALIKVFQREFERLASEEERKGNSANRILIEALRKNIQAYQEASVEVGKWAAAWEHAGLFEKAMTAIDQDFGGLEGLLAHITKMENQGRSEMRSTDTEFDHWRNFVNDTFLPIVRDEVYPIFDRWEVDEGSRARLLGQAHELDPNMVPILNRLLETPEHGNVFEMARLIRLLNDKFFAPKGVYFTVHGIAATPRYSVNKVLGMMAHKLGEEEVNLYLLEFLSGDQEPKGGWNSIFGTVIFPGHLREDAEHAYEMIAAYQREEKSDWPEAALYNRQWGAMVKKLGVKRREEAINKILDDIVKAAAIEEIRHRFDELIWPGQATNLERAEFSGNLAAIALGPAPYYSVGYLINMALGDIAHGRHQNPESKGRMAALRSILKGLNLLSEKMDMFEISKQIASKKQRTITRIPFETFRASLGREIDEGSLAIRSEMRTGNQPDLIKEMVTSELRVAFEDFRARTIPLRFEEYGTDFLVQVLTELLHQPVYSEKAGRLPPAIESRIAQTLGEGRITPTNRFQNWLQSAASDQGRVLLDSMWLERLINKSPRALYILLSALQKFQGDRKGQEPLIAVVGDEKSIVKSLEQALLRKDNGLNWEEKLEAKNFLIPQLKSLIHITSREAVSSYVESHDYGVATLGNEFLSELPLGAQFILNPSEVSDQDLVAIAFVIPALLKAAALVRGVKRNPVEQTRILKPYLQQIIPGASAQGAQGFIIQLAQYIQQVLINQKLVETSA